MKKRSRIKITDGEAIYHCISRTTAGQHLWDERAKEVMRKQLWRIADFSGVRILTYCLMSNHFHVLIQVPDRKTLAITDTELLRRYRLLYPKPTAYESARIEVIERHLAENGDKAGAWRQKMLSRMHDVSEFMKTFKQRFSIWYNHNYDRFGTHWAERFTSVLIGGSALAARTVAAYIDLNPLRAGLVHDPKDYRWCGYAEALAGATPARDGLKALAGLDAPHSSNAIHHQSHSIKRALADYRFLLFGKGATSAGSKQNAAQIPSELAMRVLKEGGKLPASTLLRCRVGYFTRGLVLGSKDFVQAQLEERLRRGEIRRKPTATSIPPGVWSGLAIAKKIH